MEDGQDIAIISLKDDLAGAQFAASLRRTGFAVLANHPVEKDLIERFYAAWAAFFASGNKQDWMRDPATHAGYFPFGEENAKGSAVKDLKEFFHIYPFADVPDICEAPTRALYAVLLDLGRQLLGWIEDSLPAAVADALSCPLCDMVADNDQSLLRVLHYQPLTGDEELAAIRAAPHEDIDLITLLLAGSQPGLQVQRPDGSWMPVPTRHDWIVVNAADMLQVATNGYFRSATHRVINPPSAENKRAENNAPNVSRFSAPMFIHPREDVELQPGLTSRQFLNRRLQDIGLGEKASGK